MKAIYLVTLLGISLSFMQCGNAPSASMASAERAGCDSASIAQQAFELGSRAVVDSILKSNLRIQAALEEYKANMKKPKDHYTGEPHYHPSGPGMAVAAAANYESGNLVIAGDETNNHLVYGYLSFVNVQSKVHNIQNQPPYTTPQNPQPHKHLNVEWKEITPLRPDGTPYLGTGGQPLKFLVAYNLKPR